jgi:hypothetical protein
LIHYDVRPFSPNTLFKACIHLLVLHFSLSLNQQSYHQGFPLSGSLSILKKKDDSIIVYTNATQIVKFHFINCGSRNRNQPEHWIDLSASRMVERERATVPEKKKKKVYMFHVYDKKKKKN